MRTVLPDFSQARILVVGDVMLDRYWQGPTSRISPEAPVPVVRVTDAEDRAGGAGNVALNISALGARCWVQGLTGEDENAIALQSCLLAQPGVECHFSTHPQQKTITKLRVLSRHQQLLRLDFEDAIPQGNVDDLGQQFSRLLPQADIVVFSDYAKGALSKVDHLIDQARKQQKRVIVDPKGMDFSRYRRANIITPNYAEFEAIVGSCQTEAEIVQKGIELCQTLQLEALLITRSEKGMTLIEPGAEPFHLPTRAREVFDVTGAGDTVVATLAAALASGNTYRDAAILANYAAGVVVGKLGTATVTPAELLVAISDYCEPLMQGVVDEKRLLELVASARANGENIVMTNGCFDLLHAGHVDYLEKASACGDRLIIAVNDDESVRRLKGDQRPINPLAQRMAVLAGLASVDWVVKFSEDTPKKLICKVLPDVLVKGGDYRPEEIAGGQCVLKNGGEVIIVDFLDGCSSSSMIEKIRKL